MRFQALRLSGGSAGRNSTSSGHFKQNLFSKRLRFEHLEDRRLLAIGIGDLVWIDSNANGLQDAGEPGLAGAGVELYSTNGSGDTLVAQTVTDANGNYSINGLSSGVNYYLTFRLPGAYTFTSKDADTDDAHDSDANAGGVTDVFTLSAGQNRSDLDAGVRGTAPAFGWANHVGGVNDECGRSIALDAGGNVYVAGTFSATADFDPGPGTFNLTPVGGTNVFVTKFSSAGALLWAKNFSGGNFDSRCQIAIDTAGNVLVTGGFSGAADFNPRAGAYPLASAGGDDIFISKLDSAGNLIWARSLGGPKDDYGLGIAVDSGGNVYTTGSFQDTADFDPGNDTFNLTSSYGSQYADIFISKLNAAGNFVWAKQMGGYLDDYGNSIAIGSDGSVYTTGSFQYTADFNPGPDEYYLTCEGNYNYADVFVSKLDSEGNFVWARQMGGPEFDCGNSLAVDGHGSVYTTGYFRETADFDPGSGTFNLTAREAETSSFPNWIRRATSCGQNPWAALTPIPLTVSPWTITEKFILRVISRSRLISIRET